MKEKHEPQSAAAISEWKDLSTHVMRARCHARTDAAIDGLAHQVKSSPGSFFSPAYQLWMADDLLRSARYEEAIETHQRLLEKHGELPLPWSIGRAGAVALDGLSLAYQRMGDPKRAIDALRQIGKSFPAGVSQSEIQYRIGAIAEEAGDAKLAIAEYKKAKRIKDDQARTDWPPSELAAREAARLEKKATKPVKSAEQLAEILARALAKRDDRKLASVASSTHFTVGVAGGERQFVPRDKTLAKIIADLASSKVRVDPTAIRGSGRKLYLHTEGWEGKVCRGRVAFTLIAHRGGWEWGGVILTQPGPEAADLLPPFEKMENQPLAISIKAPFVSGECWRAGGLNRYLSSFIPFYGIGVFLADNFSPCGYGPGGYYFNEPISHNGQDAFAVDFTRYVPGLPYIPDQGGHLALACAEGMVRMVRSFLASGSESMDNRVEISHWEGPLRCGGPPARYISKYLHLAGPSIVLVSQFMWVDQGTRLGFTDDTGRSAFDHLHFSIHDTTMGENSVRPTPMDGQSLGDGDAGRCVCSTNVARP